MYASNQPTLFTNLSGRCIFFAGVDAVGCILIGTAIAGGALAVGLSVNQAVSQCGYAHCFDGLWPDAATIENNSAQIARGWDFVSRGGQGYVWTDNNQFSQQAPTGLTHTGHPQPPIQYEPPTGPTQRNPSMEVSGFPLPGPSCPDQEGFSLNGPFDWSSFRTPPMDPGPQVHGPQVSAIKMGGTNILDYPIGTGFSGVYNRKTVKYLLMPSSSELTTEQEDAGWVRRKTGHITVQEQLHEKGLVADYYQDVGFAIIYVEYNKLVVKFRDLGVNQPLYGSS